MLASKVKRKKVYYRASWVGYDEDPEWYPASDFKYSPHKLAPFMRSIHRHQDPQGACQSGKRHGRRIETHMKS